MKKTKYLFLIVTLMFTVALNVKNVNAADTTLYEFEKKDMENETSATYYKLKDGQPGLNRLCLGIVSGATQNQLLEDNLDVNKDGEVGIVDCKSIGKGSQVKYWYEVKLKNGGSQVKYLDYQANKGIKRYNNEMAYKILLEVSGTPIADFYDKSEFDINHDGRVSTIDAKWYLEGLTYEEQKPSNSGEIDDEVNEKPDPVIDTPEIVEEIKFYVEFINRTYKINLKREDNEGIFKYNLYLKNLERGYDYYVFFMDSSDVDSLVNQKLITFDSTNGCNITESKNGNPKGAFKVGTDGLVDIDYYYLFNNLNNVVLVRRFTNQENNKKYCEIIEPSVKTETPALEEIGKRYRSVITIDETDKETRILNACPYFSISGSSIESSMVTKIGVIKDKKLLSKIARGENGANDELLKYARNAEPISILSYSNSECDSLNITNIEAEDNKYYFIYTTYEDENGYYRGIDDVTVAMGKSGYLSNDVTWSDDLIENPDTGLFTKIGFVGLILALVTISYLLIRNKSKFPKHN